MKQSLEDKKAKETYEEDKHSFITKFSARFDVDQLIQLQESEEQENKLKWRSNKKLHCEAELGEGSVKEKKIEMKLKDFELIYPKTIKYIKENIFIAEKGKI